MSLSRIVATLALLVGILTLVRATSCSSDDEVLTGCALTGVFAAIWNDNSERGLPARIAKFLVIVIMVSVSVFFMALMLNTSVCAPRP